MLTHPLWTELDQVRLIKSKSWEDVWVSDGLWKAFRPPRQTTGWGAPASGFEPQAREHLQAPLLAGGPSSHRREAAGSRADPEGPETERRGDSFPDGLACFPGLCGLATEPRIGPVYVSPTPPVLNGGRLRVRGARPRFRFHPCLGLSSETGALAVGVFASLPGRNNPGFSGKGTGLQRGRGHGATAQALLLCPASGRKVQAGPQPQACCLGGVGMGHMAFTPECPGTGPSLPPV